ncbi:MAG: exopolyphosphatase [Chlorobi bacterium]|nr:exopolyphosphatase [Chlorobiota bacterium]
MIKDKIKSTKFAAIDIGSNAIRLLLSRVYENNGNPVFKKESLIRFPLRLGDDSFKNKAISEKKAGKLINSMQAFSYLLKAYNPVSYMACATSAMRDAKNGEEIAEKIRKQTGIDLRIISGSEEAEIIFSNHFERYLDKSKSYLYIDVGGGSTEITLFSRKQKVISKSFNLGTIRLLNNLVDKSVWKELKHWIKENTKNYQPLLGIGSGGNINKIFRMAHLKDRSPLSFVRLQEIFDYLNDFSFEERLRVLKMRRDRADVIIPASEIFLTVMKWADIDFIFVPQFGLADGIVHVLFEQEKQFDSK